MVAPALLVGGVAKAAPVAAKAVPVLSSLGGILGNLGSSGILDGLLNKGSDMLNNAQYDAYAKAIAGDMANALEARAEKYDQKLQNQFNSAEPQYFQEAYTQLPELQQLMKDIAEQSTETQRGNLRQINANLAQQGVRGGQAAIIANRALGQTTRDTMRDINNLAYNEAANRQNSRLGYYSQKALTPWTEMSKAYGNSMVGANNALSQAQGQTYANAYKAALSKRGGGLFG